MLQRFLSAALLGGVALFVWNAVSWVALPLHNSSLKSFQDEDTVATVLKEHSSNKHGMYVFPSEAGEAASQKKMAEGSPFALVIYHPGGISMGKEMLTAFAIDILAAGLITIIVAMAGCRSYRRRVIMVTMICFAAGLLCNASNWIWWHFTTGFTVLELLDRLVGGVLMGMAIAKFTQPARETAPPQPVAS